MSHPLVRARGAWDRRVHREQRASYRHGQGTTAAVGQPALLPMQRPGQKTPPRIQSLTPSDKLKTSSLLKIHSYANKRRVVWWRRGCRMLWLECSSALV